MEKSTNPLLKDRDHTYQQREPERLRGLGRGMDIENVKHTLVLILLELIIKVMKRLPNMGAPR